jgi:hypothetical protein
VAPGSTTSTPVPSRRSAFSAIKASRRFRENGVIDGRSAAPASRRVLAVPAFASTLRGLFVEEVGFVVHRRDRTHVDPGEDYHAGLPYRAQRQRNDLPGGREHDRRVQERRHRVGEAAGPRGAQTPRQVPVPGSPGRHEDLHPAMSGDLDDDVGGGPEAVEPEPAPSIAGAAGARHR